MPVSNRNIRSKPRFRCRNSSSATDSESPIEAYQRLRHAKTKSSAPDVSRRMGAIKGRNNSREKQIRSLLFRMSYRFRLHWPVPGCSRRTIDIAFTRIRLAVFLDGCFWHGCELHRTFPKTNAAFWQQKIDKNIERDLETNRILRKVGWMVIRIWGHEPVSDSVIAIKTAIAKASKAF